MWDGRQYSGTPYDAPAASMAPPGTQVVLTPREIARGHDQRRRARLVRIVTLGVLVPIVLLIPSTLVPTFDIVSFVSLAIALVGTLIAYVLNRFRLIGPAGYVLLAGIAAGIAWDIVGKAHSQHGVDLGDLRLYDLFAVPILLSGVLLSRRGPVIIAAITSAFTTASLILLPKTPPLQQYWDGNYPYVLGSLYDVIAIAVLIQFLTAVVAWLGADSVRRALMDASRAEELDAANQRSAAQARELAAQRLRLQAGIQEIQQVHSAFARGSWNARARVAEGELLPVAMSLNLLLDRLTRLTREQEQRTRMEATAHELAMALRRTRAGEAYTPPAYTGTVLDEVLVELSTLRPSPASGAIQQQATGHSSGAPSLGNAYSPRSLAPEYDAPAGHEWPSLQADESTGDPREYLPEWLRGNS